MVLQFKELKFFKKAKKNLDKAISLNKDYAEGYYNLGLLFKDHEDYKSANEGIMPERWYKAYKKNII